MIYGAQCVLPIELEITSWNALNWEDVRTTADLLTLRAKQLERRDEDLEGVTARLQRMREKSAENKDWLENATDSEFKEGDLVLLYNSRYEGDRSIVRKLAFWWLGPFKVIEANNEKGYYRIAELDGTTKQGTISGRRLKPFKNRTERIRIRDTLRDVEALDGGDRDVVMEDEPTEELGERLSESSDEDLQEYIPRGQKFAVVIPSGK